MASQAVPEEKEGSEQQAARSQAAVGLKCRKLKEEQTLAGLTYKCTVTDYTFRKEDVGDAGAKQKKEKEPDDVRCNRLKKWKADYEADSSKDNKGESTKAKFWAQLSEEHTDFGIRN